MNALKKYAYQSPETVIQPLEIGRAILQVISDPFNKPQEGGAGDEGWGAPWRY